MPTLYEQLRPILPQLKKYAPLVLMAAVGLASLIVSRTAPDRKSNEKKLDNVAQSVSPYESISDDEIKQAWLNLARQHGNAQAERQRIGAQRWADLQRQAQQQADAWMAQSRGNATPQSPNSANQSWGGSQGAYERARAAERLRSGIYDSMPAWSQSGRLQQQRDQQILRDQELWRHQQGY